MPNPTLTIPFVVNAGLMTFSHRLPMAHELSTLPPVPLSADSIWNPSDHYSAPHSPIPSLLHDVTVQAYHYTSEPPSSVPYPFDPGDQLRPTIGCPVHCLHLTVSPESSPLPPATPIIHAVTAKLVPPHLSLLQPYLGYQSLPVIKATLERTTQLAKSYFNFPMRSHSKARFPALNRPRLREKVATDTFFANCRDVSGATCAQIFYGLTSHMINVYGMVSKSHAPDAYQDFLRHEGVPTIQLG